MGKIDLDRTVLQKDLGRGPDLRGADGRWVESNKENKGSTEVDEGASILEQQRRQRLNVKIKEWWKKALWGELLSQEKQGKLSTLRDYKRFIKHSFVKDKYEKWMEKLKEELPDELPEGSIANVLTREDLKAHIAEEVFTHFTESQ